MSNLLPAATRLAHYLSNRPLTMAGLVCMAIAAAAILYAALRLYLALVRYLESGARERRRRRQH